MTGAQVMRHTVDFKPGSAFYHDNHDITLVVDVRSQAFSREPHEKRQVEFLGRLTPDRAAPVSLMQIDNAHPPSPRVTLSAIGCSAAS
jgi:hypothetical protein